MAERRTDQMTDIEKLILEGIATALDTLRHIAHGTETVLPNTRAHLIQDKIEATLDSATADEVDVMRVDKFGKWITPK